MEQIVFGEYTVRDLAIVIGVVVGAIVVVTFIARMFRGRTAPEQFQKVRCKCGWVGQTSRHAGRCPRCNAPLGEQRAKRPAGPDR
jgi:hypothetical protein